MSKETSARKKTVKTPARKRKSPPVKKKSVTRAARSKPWGHVQCTVFLLGIWLLLTVFICLTLYLFILLDIPNLKTVKDYQPKMTSLVLDSTSNIIGQAYEENRRVVSLEKMPDLLAKAFVAAEDARFYDHPGVDIWSIFRALFHNIRRGARAHGGSTITQQVTRSLLLSRKKLYSRKIKEAILAYRIDSVMSKDDILYIYLNQIFLGEGAFGVGAAARTYFDRGVEDLTLGQMALLAGLPQAPSRYTPFKNRDLAKKRQAYVLNRLAEEGYITPEEARQAYEAPIYLRKGRSSFSDGEYYAQHVTNYVRARYGQEMLATGGLTIYTSMDPDIQDMAKVSIKRGLAAFSGKKSGKGPQAAMVAMEPKSGKVRAVVGGSDFATSQFNRAIQARRQPGSAFKPIIYATAFEQGFRPDSILMDEPLSLAGTRIGTTWQPKNFDNNYDGPTTLRDGLINSKNVIAVRLLQKIGVKQVVKMARNSGINSAIKPDLTLALGSSEVSLLEMTTAYGPFINSGFYTGPILIEKIVDRHGKVLEENKPVRTRVMTDRTAQQMNLILQQVIETGTGRKARGLKVAAGGKTGTTDRYMDAWFIGYTDDLVTGVWVGHDKKITLGEGGSGGQVAAPIWLDFMKQLEH